MVGRGRELKCTCTTVRKANRAISRFFEETMADGPLSVTQFAILRSLERNDETPLSQLAVELVMERTSLYRTLAPMEQLKAVKVKPAKHGNVKLAALTAKGRRLIVAAQPYWQSAQDKMIDLIGPNQWQEMQIALLKIPDLLAGK